MAERSQQLPGAESAGPAAGAEKSAGRPLWRTALFVLLASFALHRGAAAYMAYDGGLGSALAAGLALQSAFALATALGILLGRPWVLGFVIGLGASVIGTALAGGFAHGTAAALSATSVALVVGLASAALYFFLRQELGSPGREGARDR